MPNVLMLQKQEILINQREEILTLAKEYLPNIDLYTCSSTDEVNCFLEYDMVITPFLPWLPDLLRLINRPRKIHFTSSGIDFLSRYDFDFSNINITSSVGVNSVTISEYAIGAILCFAKDFHIYRDQQKNKIWNRYWCKEIFGQSVGIIGYGSIGHEVAKRSKALGLKVVVCNRTLKNSDYVDHFLSLNELDNLMSQVDYVVICLPNNKDTVGIINAKRLALLKNEAVLINVSRGELIDEEFLYEILLKNKIKGAALDVFIEEPLASESKFWDLDNVIITPHIAGTTQYYMRNMFEIISKII